MNKCTQQQEASLDWLDALENGVDLSEYLDCPPTEQEAGAPEMTRLIMPPPAARVSGHS